MKGAVYVVFSEWVSGGLKVFAICSSRKAAGMARSRVAKGKKRNHPGPAGTVTYFDADPASTPYAVQIRIVKVQVDVFYREGLDEAKLNEFTGNSNEQEIIR